jgi:Protein of unknown function (DUF3800)
MKLANGFFNMKSSLPIVDSYSDESADERCEQAFCVGAIIAGAPHWALIQDEWKKRLNGLDYFSSKDHRALGGPFQKLVRQCGSLAAARKKADAIRADLEDVLLSVDWWGGFGIVVPIADYRAIFHTSPFARHIYKDRNIPTVPAYSQMMFQIAYTARRETPDQQVGVAFYIDKSSDEKKIQDAHRAIKIIHPTIGESLVGAPVPLDDKLTPALQAADLLVGIVKDAALKWITEGRPHHGVAIEPKWIRHFAEPIGVFDSAHMLHSVTRTIRSKRFIAGTLPVQPQQISKRDRKRRQLVLIQKRQFDEALKRSK